MSLVAGCAAVPPKQLDTRDWQKATHEVLSEYQPQADAILRPRFRTAGLAYPPKQIALLAFKRERLVQLWGRNKTGPWRYVMSYPLQAFSGHSGPKLHSHDGQIPEGIYRMTMLNPFSDWHLSIGLNYPNAFDVAQANADGRTQLGRDIFIHGKNLSVGCLAIGDTAITQLFVLASEVGLANSEVIIAPNDLRSRPAVTNLQKEPSWLPKLYSKLKSALKVFHGHRV